MLDDMEEGVLEVDHSMFGDDVTNLTGVNLSLPCGLLITADSIATVEVRQYLH